MILPWAADNREQEYDRPVLRLDNITLLPGGWATLTWRSRQDGGRDPQHYAVLCSDTVEQLPAQWTVALSNVPPAGDWTTVTLPAPKHGSLHQFYRVAVVTTNGLALSEVRQAAGAAVVWHGP
jgi:hypothetical protein